MSEFDTDRNLLFGVIAMQSDLINMQQFVDSCTLWSSRKESTLADVLVQQGWLVEEDRKHVDDLRKHFPAEMRLSAIRTEPGMLVSAAVRDLSQRHKL